ncbi:hypothetical protein K353_00029 [Kitasatospora sp. SolWspMP-SS2h]|nr:hypothetical protein K353_00029 [Kitasatospora sp. SolWspMP-SS2h]
MVWTSSTFPDVTGPPTGTLPRTLPSAPPRTLPPTRRVLVGPGFRPAVSPPPIRHGPVGPVRRRADDEVAPGPLLGARRHFGRGRLPRGQTPGGRVALATVSCAIRVR